MNKIKIFQIFILLFILLVMIAIIFVSREFFLTNNQTYQPSTPLVRVKASQKTYSKLIALNQTLSPTSTEINSNPSSEEELPSIITSDQPFSEPEDISKTPTPTEIILVKADSSINYSQTTKTPTEAKEVKTIPESGFYQNLYWLLLFSAGAIIFVSFIL